MKRRRRKRATTRLEARDESALDVGENESLSPRMRQLILGLDATPPEKRARSRDAKGRFVPAQLESSRDLTPLS
jgi:hypothetical protein